MNNSTKKFLAILLSLAMLLSFPMVANAATTKNYEATFKGTYTAPEDARNVLVSGTSAKISEWYGDRVNMGGRTFTVCQNEYGINKHGNAVKLNVGDTHTLWIAQYGVATLVFTAPQSGKYALYTSDAGYGHCPSYMFINTYEKDGNRYYNKTRDLGTFSRQYNREYGCSIPERDEMSYSVIDMKAGETIYITASTSNNEYGHARHLDKDWVFNISVERWNVNTCRHKFDDWEWSDRPAVNCKRDKHYYCQYCDYVETRKEDYHNFSSFYELIDADCCEYRVCERCADCGEVLEEYTTFEHDFVWNEQGKYYQCENCGYIRYHNDEDDDDYLPETTYTDGGYICLGDDEEVDIYLRNQVYVYDFIPEKTGEYVFSSSGDYDTKCEVQVYDIDEDEYVSYADNDDDGEGNNFSVTEKFIAGHHYAFLIYMYDANDTGCFVISLRANYLEDEEIDDNPGYDDSDVTPSISFKNGGVIKVNDRKTVSITKGNQRIIYTFEPTQTGYYTFSGYGSFDTYADVKIINQTTREYQILASDDDNGDENNFSVSYYFESGKTYYLFAYMLSPRETGNFVVTLEKTGRSSSYNASTRYYDEDDDDDYEYEDDYWELDGHRYQYISASEDYVNDESSCIKITEKYVCVDCGREYKYSYFHHRGHGEYVQKRPQIGAIKQCGTYNLRCNDCGEDWFSEDRELHSYHIEKIGNKVITTCYRCGKLINEYGEEEDNDDNDDNDGDEEHQHTFVQKQQISPTCAKDGAIIRECACGEKETEVIPATGNHVRGAAVKENYVEATINSVGSYDEVIYCTVCNTEISRTKKTIPKLTHTHSYTKTVMKQATCTESGVARFTCSCGESYTEAIPKQEHNIVTRETNRIEPTCGKNGSYVQETYCTKCLNGSVETITIPATRNHIAAPAVKENQVAATSSQEGSYDEVVYCKVCGTEMSRTKKVITKLVHTHNYVKVADIPATCVASGYRTFKCDCGASYNESVPATGVHNYSPEYIVIAATPGVPGVKAQTCFYCGNIIASPIPAPPVKNYFIYKGVKYTKDKSGAFVSAVMPATSITKTKVGKKKVTLNWTKDKTASGYQVQVATDKKFTKGKKTVSLTSNKKTSTTISKLSSKKVYYARVRTYKNVKIGGKTYKAYSKWSIVKKTAKIK